MPRSVAAGTSMLSTPIPARPITLSSSAAAISAGRHLGRRAHRQPVVLADRAPRARRACSPIATSASIPRSAKTATARGLSSSAINTFGIQYLRTNHSTRGRQRMRRGTKSAAAARADDDSPRPRTASLYVLGRLGGGALLAPRPSRATAAAPRRRSARPSRRPRCGCPAARRGGWRGRSRRLRLRAAPVIRRDGREARFRPTAQ